MRKKIIFIQQTSSLGGSGISLLNTVNMLKDLYEITVYCPLSPKDLTNVLRNNGIVVKNYNFQIGSINYYSGGPKLISRSFFLALKNIHANYNFWREEFLKEKPDYVVVNSMILAWMEPLIKEVRAISVCFVRETLPTGLNYIQNAIIKKYLNRFSGVAFISKYDMTKFNLRGPKTAIIRDSLMEDVELSPLLTDLSWPWEFQREKINLLFVGGCDPIKGLFVALKSLNKLKGLSLQLIVAGYTKEVNNHKCNRMTMIGYWRSRYIRRIKSILKDKDISEKVRFIGLQEDMSVVYKNCDVLLFPSTVPHQSRPAFEIGLYKKTVIISDFEETKEYVIDGENGLTFKPNNHSNLAEKIKWLYNNSEDMKKLGEKNVIMTKELHSYENVKNELLLFFSYL